MKLTSFCGILQNGLLICQYGLWHLTQIQGAEILMQNTVNWALIGCGDISERRIAPAMRDLKNCDLVSVSRAQSDLAAAFAGRFEAKRWYSDWVEQIKDPDIDAVYVATPVNLHTEQTIAAAEAGKHVLCEKPMAMNAAECRKMIAACEVNGVKLGIAYYRHYYPVIHRIKELIQSEKIGKVTVAQMNAFSRHNPQPGEPRAWLLDAKQSGGGPMIDFGVHRLEVLIHLFGDVSHVTGTTDNLYFKDRDVEDTAITILRFKKDVQAVLTTTHTALDNQDTLDIFGTRGSIRVPSLNKGDILIYIENTVYEESLPSHKNIHLPLIEDFAEAIQRNRNPGVGGDIGLKVTEIVDQIYGNK